MPLVFLFQRELTSKFFISTGLSDPFCIVRVNNAKKFKTNVAYETLSPVWNESVSIAMPQEGDKISLVSSLPCSSTKWAWSHASVGDVSCVSCLLHTPVQPALALPKFPLRVAERFHELMHERAYRLTLFYDLIFFMQDVFDKDVFQNDFMGTVSLTVEEIKEASKVFTLIILKVNSLFEFPTLIRSEVKWIYFLKYLFFEVSFWSILWSVSIFSCNYLTV